MHRARSLSGNPSDVYSEVPVRISAGVPNIFIEVFLSFSQCSETNAE
jgi:hypothetical protein